MKAVAYYDLPMGESEDSLRALVEKAREQGLPLLAVVFEAPEDGAPEIDGLTVEQERAMALGFAISEMEHELNTISPMRLRKIAANVLNDDDPLAEA